MVKLRLAARFVGTVRALGTASLSAVRLEAHALACASNGSIVMWILDQLQKAYFLPRARVDLAGEIAGAANCAIDISDGFLQDLDHVLRASNVGAAIESTLLPVFPGATLEDALQGGDDYELLCTGAYLPSFTRVGEIVAEHGLHLDGEEIEPRGYNHFRS